jgi:lipoate-protein ligase A
VTGVTGGMQTLEVLEFAASDAATNMAVDAHLLRLCEAGARHGFLRFYTWTRPALSLGFFERIETIDSESAERDGVEIIRRPTGGRAVLHGDDLTYAFVIPRQADHNLTSTYRVISECIIGGIALLGPQLDLERGSAGKTDLKHKPCFGSTSRYEVVHRGRKLVGSAQRVGEKAILQHGSIPLGRTYLDVADYIACKESDRARLRAAVEGATCCLNDLVGSAVSPRDAAAALERGFAGRFGLRRAKIAIASLGSGVGDAADTLRSARQDPKTLV